jgi:proline iminopeptidase
VRVSIGDCRLYIDVEGLGLVPDGPTMRERPVVLVLHGGPGFDHTSFKPRFGTLADVAQLIYVDQRGQGRSDRSSPDHWNFARWADDVAALADALGLESPIVYGVSFGSMVALHYAVRHPGHASKVILDSTAASADTEAVVAAFDRLGGPDAADAARAFWEHTDEDSFLRYLTTCMPLYNRHPQPDSDLVQQRSFEHANFDLFQHWVSGERRRMDLLGEVDAIASRVLVLAGEDDPVTPPAGARALADALGPERCTLEVFADCGHGVWRDQPEAAFAAMRSFITA